jgi:hypothetical protein
VIFGINKSSTVLSKKLRRVERAHGRSKEDCRAQGWHWYGVIPYTKEDLQVGRTLN